MTKEKLEQGIVFLEKIRRNEDIIRRLETHRISELCLDDGSSIVHMPRGAVKDAIIDDCRSKIEEYNKRIEEL